MLKPKAEVPHRCPCCGGHHPTGTRHAGETSLEGLLGGMWEFPNGRVTGDPARGLPKALKTGYGLKVRAGESLGNLNHAYTHFRVTVHVFSRELKISIGENEAKRMKKNYKMGKIIRTRKLPDGKN